MSETLKVIDYLESEDYFKCEDNKGFIRRIDLITSGCLPVGIDPNSLVGKTVNIEYTHPFIEMAEGVEIVASSVNEL